MTLPSFVIAGAQKCGTTTLAGVVRQHPEVHLSKRKEIHFFDRHFDRGLEWYESQFSPKPHHRQVGEATPAYMYDATARERLTQTLPEARLVIILRNPVDRAYSHYWHKRRLGDEPLATFEEAMDAEPERRARTGVRARIGFAYVDRGHYVDQLEELAAAQGRERLHVMLLDDLVSDRVATMRALLEFLEIDPEPAASLEVRKRNSYRVTDDSGTTETVPYSPMPAETRARLTEFYADSNARLADFLGRDLSAWQQA